MSASPEAARADIARTAGRGVVYITFAKLFFIGVGYAIHFALPRLLDADPERAKALYGIYGVVSSLLNVLNMVVIQGAVQAVSKLVTEQESHAADVRRSALKVQAWIGGGLALAYFAAADGIAYLQRNPELALYHRIAAAVVLFYGFYGVFIGVLNGRREFRRQALFDMSFATLKMALVVGAAALGLSMTGVLSGFAGAALLICVGAAAVVGVRGGESSPALQRRLFAFMLPVMAYTAVINLLLNVDLWVLAGHVSAGAITADYTAAQVISRIPYQATLSITFVVFPLVSRSTFEGDIEATRGYIRVTLRYSLVVLGCLVSVLGGAAAEVVVVAYPKDYGSAAPLLQWLSVGMLFFSVFSISGSIITGSGRATLALSLGLAALAVDIALCYALVPELGPVGAAIATSGALLVGTMAALAVLWRSYRAGLPLWCTVRVAIAGAAVVGVSYALPSPSKLVTVAKCALLVLLYFGVLIVTRELVREDWLRVKRVFLRRSAAREAP